MHIGEHWKSYIVLLSKFQCSVFIIILDKLLICPHSPVQGFHRMAAPDPDHTRVCHLKCCNLTLKLTSTVSSDYVDDKVFYLFLEIVLAIVLIFFSNRNMSSSTALVTGSDEVMWNGELCVWVATSGEWERECLGRHIPHLLSCSSLVWRHHGSVTRVIQHPHWYTLQHSYQHPTFCLLHGVRAGADFHDAADRGCEICIPQRYRKQASGDVDYKPCQPCRRQPI